MPMKLEVTGIEQMRGTCKLMQMAVRDDATRRSVVAAAAVIRKAEIARAPVLDLRTAQSSALEPGALKADIRVSIKKERDGYITAFIGPKRRTARVAHLVEYGHRLVKGGKSSVGVKGAVGAGHQIGNVPAHAFLRPAFDTSWRASLATFAETLKQLLKGVLS